MTDVSNSMAKILLSSTQDFPLTAVVMRSEMREQKSSFLMLHMSFNFIKRVTNSVRSSPSHSTSN